MLSLIGLDRILDLDVALWKDWCAFPGLKAMFFLDDSLALPVEGICLWPFHLVMGGLEMMEVSGGDGSHGGFRIGQ